MEGGFEAVAAASQVGFRTGDGLFAVVANPDVYQPDTLVIETIGLYSDTTFPVPSTPYLPPIGENVHVVERLRLNEQDRLVIDTVLTAPQLLTAPIRFTTVYQRDPGYIYRDHDICSVNDRSVDPATGFERFDLTPPPDLPPPPPPPN